MCTRYVLRKEDLTAVLAKLEVELAADAYDTRYNIPPGTDVPVVRAHSSHDAASRRECVLLRWGLVPAWARDAREPIVNARAESVAEKPSFRQAFRQRRCLVPASGFYEWHATGRVRKPWLLQRTGREPFCFAGIWDRWQGGEGPPRETFAMITMAPNELMAPIHSRMPLILTEDKWPAWLDPAHEDPAHLSSLLAPWPASAMAATRVTMRMNHPRFDDAACLEPVSEDEDLSGDPDQLSLF